MLHDIAELFPDFVDWPQRIGSLSSVVNGNPHQRERDDLCRLVEGLRARTVFEFGTFNGATAATLAAIRTVEQVWTLDLPDGVEPVLPMLESDREFLHFDSRLRMAVLKVERLYGDSALFDFSPYYGRCDVVFVMGAHSLPYVRSDLANALRMVTSDGVVVWHAGTPDPVETISQEYDVFLMNERMGLVRPALIAEGS